MMEAANMTGFSIKGLTTVKAFCNLKEQLIIYN
jgi:hypothetical protein